MKVLILTLTLFYTFTSLANERSNDDTTCTSDNCLAAMNQAKKLARWGNPRAQYLIGIAYINGDGLSKDTEKGMYNLRNASRAGLPHASYQLAYEYKTGINVEADESRYMKFLEHAASLGYKKARFEFAALQLKTDKKNEALQTLIELSEVKYKPAMYLLVKMYLSKQYRLPYSELAVADMLYTLTQSNFKDARAMYQSSFATNETINHQVVSNNNLSNNSQDKIERITVSGTKEDITSALDDFVTMEKKYSLYDGSTTGSRIKGKLCGSSGLNCKAISGHDLNVLEAGKTAN